VRSFRTIKEDESGVAAVEFALMLPFFVVFLFGSLDAAYLLFQSHRVEQGLELSGSYLSKAPDPQSVSASARQLAVTGELTGGTPRVKGWSASDITVTYRAVSGEFREGDSARVVVISSVHDYKGFGFLNSIMGGGLKIRATHEERIGA
jgi:Flp pilus assembly protein TadG